jgi:ABC-type phosphate transport system substrate-binding protein
MINIKKPVVLGVVASLALGIFAAVPAAHADPVAGSYVAVGSDTLDSSMNALTNGTAATGSDVRILAAGGAVGSFDAFGSATIQTKSEGPYYTRPSGSGEGVNALIASIKGTALGATYKGTDITGQVDIARSSSGPGTNANAAGKLTYVPYARDAVAYAYYGPSADLGNLTTAQLKDLYTNGPTAIGSTLVTPLIPQSASGTRKFFLSAIGVSTDATCGMSTCTTSTLPENDASVLTAGTIIPFSAANWIAQANHVAQNTIPTTNVVALGAPNGVAAYTGTGTSLVPSATFYNAAPFGRDTYLVVEFARVDPTSATYDATLAGLVNSTVATSLTNFGTAPSQPGAVKKKFGFLAPSTTTPARAYTW